MNLQYIRYALEIARTGSISKAAENLSVAQPNLSRAVKELESGLGIAIFERTRTGMAVTPDGERLLSAGERILREVGELEVMFEGDAVPRQSLSLVYPYADYIVRTLSDFARELPESGRYDLTFREVGAMDAINLVASGESRVGIIRVPAHNERYYTDRLAERELSWEKVASLPAVILTTAAFPTDTPGHRELNDLCAVTLPDAPGEVGQRDMPRRRMVVDSMSLLWELLKTDPTTYTITLPLTSATRQASGLHQYPVTDPDLAPVGEWTDFRISPQFYRPSALDQNLLERLRRTAKP